jgi:succinate dehydrogenase / fumarate reductase cytochrome b subunit
MHKSRPKNLNLFTIRFPLPAIVSILHRISGVALFIFIPFLLSALNYSLTFSGFEDIHEWLSKGYIKFIIWVLFAPFCFHLIAGIRHLLSDIHVGDSLKGGRRAAFLTMIFSLLFLILAGVWLW